jgi:FkbM family methyltransferase
MSKQVVDIFGKQFQVDGNEEFWLSASKGKWEPETFRVFDAYLSSDSVFVDIGAWVGATTLYAASIANRVLCFEPDPRACARLRQNLKLNPSLEERVILRQAAVAAEDSVRRLFCRWNWGDSGSSMLTRIRDRGSSVEVQTSRLETVISQEGIDKICFIKMDIEGGEFEVLPELLDTLVRQMPTLYISFHLTALSESLVREVTPNRLAVKASSVAGKILGWDPAREQARIIALAKLRDLFDSLSFYTHIYTADGESHSASTLLDSAEELGNSALVFSNIPWSTE